MCWIRVRPPQRLHSWFRSGRPVGRRLHNSFPGGSQRGRPSPPWFPEEWYSGPSRTRKRRMGSKFPPPNCVAVALPETPPVLPPTAAPLALTPLPTAPENRADELKRSREPASGAPTLGSEDIRMCECDVITRNGDIEIVLKRQFDNVLEGKMQLAVTEQGVQTFGVAHFRFGNVGSLIRPPEHLETNGCSRNSYRSSGRARRWARAWPPVH